MLPREVDRLLLLVRQLWHYEVGRHGDGVPDRPLSRLGGPISQGGKRTTTRRAEESEARVAGSGGQRQARFAGRARRTT